MLTVSKRMVAGVLIGLLPFTPVTAQPVLQTSTVASEGRDRVTQPAEAWIFTEADFIARFWGVKDMCQQAGLYRIDCIAERLEAMEQDSVPLRRVAKTRPALQAAARELRYIVRGNRDPLKPRVKLENSKGHKSHRPLVAVAPNRLGPAAERAVMALIQAEAELLEQLEDNQEITRQVTSAFAAQRALL